DAQKATGLREAVVTGVCQIEGTLTVIVVLDFSFLAGSMGCVVGEKVALAFEHAVKKKLPLVAVVSSGGVRVQEGVLALMQTAKTAAAARRLHSARLPFISVLTNPTTGDVYASFANLGDIIIAEPHALLGFAPIKVVEETEGRELPRDSHTAESHLKHGMVDCVVERSNLRGLLATMLDLLSSQYRLAITRRFGPYPPIVPQRESAWQSVQLARHRERPTSLDYVSRIASSFIELHGDRYFRDDPAIVCGLADIGGEAVVVIAQERGHDGEMRNHGRAHPEGFRKAQRAMFLAAKFRLTLITFIDTPGAYPGLDAEERGLGNAIARCLAIMSDLGTPTISVIIGEGGSKGALATGVADRVLMLENAIFSVMPPERAATLLYHDESKAAEVAPALRLTAKDCLDLGVVDVVVAEPKGGAHTDPDEAARQLKRVLLSEMVQVRSASLDSLIRARYDKFRSMGRYTSRISAALSKDMAQIQDYVADRVEGIMEYLPSRAHEVPLKDEGQDKNQT
ncbi:MAG: carboxyl transferase domain-containing protein, partial [Chloroflexota bacterium]|nr:carboxyl transferase domain-containing protein [Chloroflexota bacterium]